MAGNVNFGGTPQLGAPSSPYNAPRPLNTQQFDLRAFGPQPQASGPAPSVNYSPGFKFSMLGETGGNGPNLPSNPKKSALGPVGNHKFSTGYKVINKVTKEGVEDVAGGSKFNPDQFRGIQNIKVKPTRHAGANARVLKAMTGAK